MTTALFGNDDRWLITADREFHVKIWNLQEVDQVDPVRTLQHESLVKSGGFLRMVPHAEECKLALAGDGKRLVAFFRTRIFDKVECEMVVWDFGTDGQQVTCSPLRLSDAYGSWHVSPDLKWGGACIANDRQRLFDLTRTPPMSSELSGTSLPIGFSPKGKYLVTTAAGRIWFYYLGDDLAQTLSNVYSEEAGVIDGQTMEFSADGTVFATQTESGTKLWFLTN